jgi:hypothetical protein
VTKLRQALRALRLNLSTALTQSRSGEYNRAQRSRRRARHRSIFDDLVEKMTNHERSIWAKAGYPGLRGQNVKQLQPYAAAAERRISRGVGRRVR